MPMRAEVGQTSSPKREVLAGFKQKYLPNRQGKGDFSETREEITPPIRELNQAEIELMPIVEVKAGHSEISDFEWIKAAGLAVGDKLIVCGQLPSGVGKHDHKTNQKDNAGNDNQNLLRTHSLTPLSLSDDPQIYNQGQNSRSNIEVQQGHCSFSDNLDNFTAIVKNNMVKATPMTNTAQTSSLTAPGTKIPTTREANTILAPSRKKSETTFNSAEDNIQTNAITNSVFVKDFLSQIDIFDDEIVSIEYAGEEQVYDIEVEGTHNFVANSIIAHNTYLRDALTVGQDSTGYEVKFYGETTAKYMLWDGTNDTLDSDAQLVMVKLEWSASAESD